MTAQLDIDVETVGLAKFEALPTMKAVSAYLACIA
jgi:hypothetical protein